MIMNIFREICGSRQVASFGADVSSALYKSFRDVKNAARDIKALAEEVDATTKVLDAVASLLGNPKTASLHTTQLITDTENVLDGCRKVFDELDSAAKQASGGLVEQSTWGRLTTKAKRPLSKGRVTELQGVLERYRGVMHMMLTVLQIGEGRSAATTKDLQSLEQRLEALITTRINLGQGKPGIDTALDHIIEPSVAHEAQHDPSTSRGGFDTMRLRDNTPNMSRSRPSIVGATQSSTSTVGSASHEGATNLPNISFIAAVQSPTLLDSSLTGEQDVPVNSEADAPPLLPPKPLAPRNPILLDLEHCGKKPGKRIATAGDALDEIEHLSAAKLPLYTFSVEMPKTWSAMHTLAVPALVPVAVTVLQAIWNRYALAAADSSPLIEDDLAVYGLYKKAVFHSSPHTPPTPNIIRWDDGACSSGYVLASLNGPSVPHPGPSIFTTSGDLIWHSSDYGVAMNLRLQRYNDSPVLTFWAGEKAATSGRGSYYILNERYELVRKVDAMGEGLFGDLHEFLITPENTAILTVYNTTIADLSGMGLGRGERSWVTDSLFQEIDLETGELLFQWSALDHFDPTETYMGQPLSGFSEDNGFDSFHINSVDRHPVSSDYLVSSRHTHTVSLISGEDGEVLWVLGGADNDFEDLALEAREGGGATEFRWQHDARFVDATLLPGELRQHGDEEEGVYYISLFDNQKAGPLHRDATQSRGLILRLDTRDEDFMTAEIVQSFTSTYGTLAGSQGSVQILPPTMSSETDEVTDAKVLIGWGASAMYTQHSFLTGEVECEIHFAPSITFSWERAKSYHFSKIAAGEWIGKPGATPDVSLAEGKIWVSWNGDTGVRNWELQGRLKMEEEAPGDEMQESWVTLSTAPRSGFETMIEMPNQEEKYSSFRIVGVDDHRAALGISGEFALLSPDAARSWTRTLFLIFFGLVALLAAVIGISALGLLARALPRKWWTDLGWDKLSQDFKTQDWSFEALRGGPKSPKYRPL
nr:hypothetical protein B0A51_00108 [Rachicladosporium sp. CCFEE 5018]